MADVTGGTHVLPNQPPRRILVTWRDERNIARAYAYGPEEQREDVRAEASRQLDLYIEGKPPAMAPDREDFTEHEEPFNG